MQIPEKICGYNIYDKGERLIGITGDVELPNFEAMTSPISGAGILGEYESPVVGHFGSMKLVIPYRVITSDTVRIAEPKHQLLTLRADQNSYDVSEGIIGHHGLRVIVGGIPVGFNPGTVKTGDGMGAQVTIEIAYIKITLDDETLVELDKLNYIYTVNGIDYLAETRKNI